MYDAKELSYYIINYSNRINTGISNLKLQKLLYFIQGYFLVEYNEPAFYQDIEAWPYGPVVDDVYQHFKQFGSNNLQESSEYFDFNKWEEVIIDPNFKNISTEHKKAINSVIDVFKNTTASKLVSITHKQYPWIQSYSQKQYSIIPNEKIKNYFEEHYTNG